VYAWFYPLRIATRDLDEFMAEMLAIQNYDSTTLGKPKHRTSVEFAWRKIILDVELGSKEPTFDSFRNIWDAAIADEQLFYHLRAVFMRASLFLNPLYVGKTRNLHNRCYQHVNGVGGSNNFYERFMNYASKNKLNAKTVSDLIFACIRTDDESIGSPEELELLVEDLLKYLANPSFSIK